MGGNRLCILMFERMNSSSLINNGTCDPKKACANNDLLDKFWNMPEYIQKACAVCDFSGEMSNCILLS